MTDIMTSIEISFKVAAVATIFTTFFGLFISYILARKNFRGRTTLEIILTLPLVLPPTATGYLLIVLFGRNGFIGKHIFSLTGYSIMFTWQAAVLATFVVSLPLMIKTCKAAIKSVDENLIEASYTLGRSEFETARKLILPLAKNGIIAGVILAFARGLGEFGATIMLAGNIKGKTNTMALSIYSYASSGEWNKAQIMVLIFMVISFIFLYLVHKLTERI